MNRSALAPALAAALLTALAIAAWTLWPAPAATQAIPNSGHQFPGIEYSDCTAGSVTPARQEFR